MMYFWYVPLRDGFYTQDTNQLEFFMQIEQDIPMFSQAFLHRVAPQLTVVSAPLRYEAFQRMRRTPTLLGWGPASRWDMKR